MTIVRRPSPFGELMSLRSAMDRLFEDSFVRPPFGAPFDSSVGLPPDVTRTSDALVVEAALPGIRPEDVDITVEDGTLSIRAESRDERRQGKDESESLVSEIRRGTLSRSVTLPTGLEPDKATATFEHGVLTLRIPKAESVKPRQIRISPTTEGHARSGQVGAGQVGAGQVTDANPGERASNGSTPEGSTPEGSTPEGSTPETVGAGKGR